MEKKKKLKTAKLTKEEDEFWDVESLGGRLVDSSRRRKIYDLNGAQVSLAYLSSEMCTGDTFWVTPLGEGFSDIRKRSPLVNVKELLDGGDPKKLQAAIESLSLEAILLREVLSLETIKRIRN